MARKSIEYVSQSPEATQEWLDGRRLEGVECIIGDLVGMSHGKVVERQEAEAFLEVISPWEREHLLLNV